MVIFLRVFMNKHEFKEKFKKEYKYLSKNKPDLISKFFPVIKLFKDDKKEIAFYLLDKYPFKTKTDKFILQQYANGLSSREIETLLANKKNLEKLDHASICRKINKIVSICGRLK